MKPTCNAFQLKLFAASWMVLDHIDHIPALALHNNIFLTLALGVLMLCVLAGFGRDTAVGHRPLRIAGAALLVLAAAMCAEGGAVLLPFMLITYACRARPRLRAGLYLGFALALFAVDFVPYPTLHETLYMLAFNSDFLVRACPAVHRVL